MEGSEINNEAGNAVLPDSPAELVRLALSDLAKIEADPYYIVRPMMDIWHFTQYHGGYEKCEVCFAGAVMAKTLGADIMEDLAPGAFNAQDGVKLMALDAFREGHLMQGIGWLMDADANLIAGMMNLENVPEIQKVCPYREDPEAFKADMEKVAVTLESIERSELWNANSGVVTN